MVDVGLRAAQFYTGLRRDGILLSWDREVVSLNLLDMDGKWNRDYDSLFSVRAYQPRANEQSTADSDRFSVYLTTFFFFFLVSLIGFNVALNAGVIINDELEMWRESFVACFKHLPKGTENLIRNLPFIIVKIAGILTIFWLYQIINVCCLRQYYIFRADSSGRTV